MTVSEAAWSSPAEAIDLLVDRVCAAASREPSLSGQVHAALRALLGALAEDAELAHAAIAQLDKEAEPGHDPYRSTQRRFASMLERAAGSGVECPPDTPLAVAGGVAAVISREVGEGRGETLMAVLPDLVFLVLAPFLGPEMAEEEMRRSRPR